MTEQPKFQRRKKRGPVGVSDQAETTASASKPDLTAILAEKEELLQRKAELEADRLREEQAEQSAAPKPAAPIKPKRPLVLAQSPEPVEESEPEIDRAAQVEKNWTSLDRFPLDPMRLARQNVITALRRDPAHARFDILRTRMLQALSENGWRRVAITSPTKDCGKTFTAANLAISLSRQDNCRTVLLDLDMRSPSLHKIFNVSDPGVIGDLLREGIAPERHLQGFAPNDISVGSRVAIGFNGLVEPYAAELLQDPSTERVLQRIEEAFDPTVMLFDLPPALLNDDVLAMRPHFDALLIVAGGGTTRAKDIKETEQRLGSKVPLLGVILNMAEDADASGYAY